MGNLPDQRSCGLVGTELANPRVAQEQRMFEQENRLPAARTRHREFTDIDRSGATGEDKLAAGDDDDLSVEDLKRQQEELNRKIAEKQEAEKKAVIDQIVNVVNTYN